ncbi:MAG: hypothetical protein K1000chlam2_00306 [Chlamydiae bacterium]|nr:hypothetical protein [Chlamydiota bacterium]
MRMLWRAKQTQIEFVELEGLFIGEKMAFIGGGMNSPMHSKFELATNGLTVFFIPTLNNIPQILTTIELKG